MRDPFDDDVPVETPGEERPPVPQEEGEQFPPGETVSDPVEPEVAPPSAQAAAPAEVAPPAQAAPPKKQQAKDREYVVVEELSVADILRRLGWGAEADSLNDVVVLQERSRSVARNGDLALRQMFKDDQEIAAGGAYQGRLGVVSAQALTIKDVRVGVESSVSVNIG